MRIRKSSLSRSQDMGRAAHDVSEALVEPFLYLTTAGGGPCNRCSSQLRKFDSGEIPMMSDGAPYVDLS
jgi:hypothetical protein